MLPRQVRILSSPGVTMKCIDLCRLVTDLLLPANFCLLQLTIHKLMLSVLLTKEDNGEKAHVKRMLG